MKEPNPYIIDRMKKIKNIRTYSEKKKILIKSKLKRIKLDKTIKKYIIKKWNNSATKIQSFIRCYLQTIKFKYNFNKFRNEYNLMQTPINKIEKIYLIYHKNYFFDIREINKNFENNYFLNPYDRKFFPKYFIDFVNRKINNYNLKNIPLVIESFNIFNYTAYVTYIFNKISEYGNYPNVSTYLNYSTDDLFYFMLYISKFKIIFDYIDLDLYNNMLEGVDYFDSEESFKKNICLIIEKLIFLEDNCNDLRAMLISNCLYTDVKFKYFNKYYLNEDFDIYNSDSEYSDTE